MIKRYTDKATIADAARAAELDQLLGPLNKELKELKERLRDQLLDDGVMKAVAGNHAIVLTAVAESAGTFITEEMVGTFVGGRDGYYRTKVT